MINKLFKRKDRFHILTYILLGVFILLIPIAWAANSDIDGCLRLFATTDDSYFLRGYSARNGTEYFSVDVTGNAVVTGLTTSTGAISSTEIADVTRSFPIQTGSAYVDDVTFGGPITGSTAPNLYLADGIPAIIWDASTEVTAVVFSFRLPSDYVSDLTVYAMVSSSDASGAGTIMGWNVWLNKDDDTFETTGITQETVTCTSSFLSTSNEVLTLSPYSTTEALFTAGQWLTLKFYNASTDDYNLELKGLDVRYTATQ